MRSDVLVSSGWRSGDLPPVTSPRSHLTLLPSTSNAKLPSFRRKIGRHTVLLTREENAFVVRVTSTGLLIGPTETVYEAHHADERYACWDVMARVIRASRDEDEGVRAGRDAAAWVSRYVASADSTTASV